MSISQDDASEALRQVDEAKLLSVRLRGYRLAAPHLMLWGFAYFLAYTWTYLRPSEGGLVWAFVVPVAALGDLLIARHGESGGLDASQMNILVGAFATFLAFITATALIMQPHDPRQMAAFVPLVVATAYIMLGFGKGTRLVLTGVALGVLTLTGYFVLPGFFMLWMAAVGGGALLLGGWWLRQV